jgi:hypothetical protein
LAFRTKHVCYVGRGVNLFRQLRGSDFNFRLPPVHHREVGEVLFVYVTLPAASLTAVTKGRGVMKQSAIHSRTTIQHFDVHAEI